MKSIFYSLMFLLLVTNKLHADTYVKLLSDSAESDIYINGEVSATFYDEPVQFILPPGEYLIEVKKEYGDGSYGYFKRVLKAGKIDTKVAIKAEFKKEFTHDYYLKRTNTLAGAESYLERFPDSKFTPQVRDFVEREYATQATTIEDAKAYLTRYPNGRYKSAVMERDIFLVSVYKEERDGVVETNHYEYNEQGQLLKDTYKSSDGYWKKQTYNYNDQGLLSDKRVERKGQVTLKDVYSYNENGLLKEERHYQEDKYTRNVSYQYDSKGNRTEKLNRTVLYGNFRDFMSYKIDYEYDDRGNLIRKYEEHLKNGDWKQFDYRYDETGFLISKRKQEQGYRDFDKTYNYTKPTIEYVNDDQGRLIEETIDPDSKYPIKVDYRYSSSGLLIEKNKRFTDGRRIRYTYDASENLIEEHYFPDSDGDTYTKSWQYQSFKVKNLLKQPKN
ncbi:hypothetical protein [Alkalimarinus sediminis]|uniref:PEGA domain-containing protein n=1 Tax=Alkalimarinus sediminis TaxID=1632866 RepID=A0A9E8KPL6_9ALTE|nr:hypothetical protein [Alkalimarinus sediminis]UZW73642.1 hypothetical protein NNL22_11395 [Alkalimarinus sediminis]